MIEVLVALSVIAVLLVAGVAGVLTWYRATLVQRAKQRIDAETRLAEWQLKAMARQAMLSMLDAARQPSGRSDR